MERRRAKRINMRGASMVCRSGGGAFVDVSTIFDISEGGLGFCTREKLDVGSPISFDFVLPTQKKGKEVYGEGKVVWMVQYCDVFGDTVTRCGLQFKNLPSASMGTIRKYVRLTLKKK